MIATAGWVCEKFWRVSEGLSHKTASDGSPCARAGRRNISRRASTCRTGTGWSRRRSPGLNTRCCWLPLLTSGMHA